MELSPYLRPLRRWWWLVVVVTLLAGGSAYVVTRDSPLTYVARATLIVGPSIAEPNPSTSDLNLTNQLAQVYADLALRDPVQSETQKALGLNELPDYSVVVLPDSRLLEITVTDTDPRRAAAVANELSSQLIAASPEGSQSPYQSRRTFINEQLANLESSITETQSELETAQAKLTTLKSAVEIADAQDQITALESKIASLQSNYASLLAVTSQGAPNSLSVVEPAIMPTVPIGFSRNMLVALASLIGLALSLATSYLLDLVDDRIRQSSDLSRATGWPILGDMTGTTPAVLEGQSSAWAAAHNPNKKIGTLLANLTYSPSLEYIQKILVSDMSDRGTSSLLAASLAIAMAESGKKVLAIDADIWDPKLQEWFDTGTNSGMSPFLGYRPAQSPTISRKDLDGLVQSTAVPNLDIVGVGDTSEIGEIVSVGPVVHQLLQMLDEDYDKFIVLGPAFPHSVDSFALCRYTEGVLVAVDAGDVRRGDLADTVHELEGVSANVIGVVFNRPKRRFGVRRGERPKQEPEEIFDATLQEADAGEAS